MPATVKSRSQAHRPAQYVEERDVTRLDRPLDTMHAGLKKWVASGKLLGEDQSPERSLRWKRRPVADSTIKAVFAWSMSNLARGGWTLNKQVADVKLVEVLDKGKTV